MEKSEQELMEEAKEREFPKERPDYWPLHLEWPPDYSGNTHQHRPLNRPRVRIIPDITGGGGRGNGGRNGRRS